MIFYKFKWSRLQKYCLTWNTFIEKTYFLKLYYYFYCLFRYELTNKYLFVVLTLNIWDKFYVFLNINYTYSIFKFDEFCRFKSLMNFIRKRLDIFELIKIVCVPYNHFKLLFSTFEEHEKHLKQKLPKH